MNSDTQLQKYSLLSSFFVLQPILQSKRFTDTLEIVRNVAVIELLLPFLLPRQEWELREALWPQFDTFYPAHSKSPTDPEFFVEYLNLKIYILQVSG